MGAIKTSLSFDEFERLPDRPGKQELLQGELIELPPPESSHSRISLKIFKRLDEALESAHARGDAADLGDAFHETGYQLSRDVYVIPDVSVNHAAQEEGKYFQGSPAIAIEVISPSNSAEDLLRKTKVYFQFGAREVWQFYPNLRAVLVYTSPAQVSEVGEDDSLSTPLLPGFSLPIRDLLSE
jgi:Uma2 family endonuclease